MRQFENQEIENGHVVRYVGHGTMTPGGVVISYTKQYCEPVNNQPKGETTHV